MRAEMTQLKSGDELRLDENKTDMKRLRDIEKIVGHSNDLLKKEVVPALRILSICCENEERRPK